MINSSADNNQRLIEAIVHLVKGWTLIWRSPGMVRARAFLIALHVAPAGFAYQLYFPSGHNDDAIAVYTTLVLLLMAARSGPPPAQGLDRDQGHVDINAHPHGLPKRDIDAETCGITGFLPSIMDVAPRPDPLRAYEE